MNQAIMKTAVIYIGSKAITMKITERNKNHELITLESIEYPIELGTDTFKNEHISYQHLNEICQILNQLKGLLEDYQVEMINLFATTAIRESNNRDFIVDQIRHKTGFYLTVLSDSEEKSYIYKGIQYILDEKEILNQNLLFCYIGTGRFSMALSKNKDIVDYINLRFGSIKLNEILRNLKDKMTHFSSSVENYLNSFTHMLEKFISNESIESVIMTGKEMDLLRNILNIDQEKKIFNVPLETFEKIYDDFSQKDFVVLSEQYDLTIHEVERLTISLTIYSIIFNIASIESIYCVNFTLEDIITIKKLLPDTYNVIEKRFTNNIIRIAYTIGEKYKFDKKHAVNVTNNALKFFDETQEIHGLEARDRLLLQIAGILHDIGKYISLKQHYKHSYYILKSSDILGLSTEENRIIAYIARYHSYKSISLDTNLKLNKTAHMKVLKLTALLRLADSLDRSHNQPVTHFSVSHEDAQLIISIEGFNNLDFEMWSLKAKSDLFEKIFGIQPIIKRKGF